MIDDIAFLVHEDTDQDRIGQPISIKTERMIYVGVKSVTRQEWMTAGQMGFKPSFCLVTHYQEYNDEHEVIYKGVRYGIYRTYINGDNIELYCERKAGARP